MSAKLASEIRSCEESNGSELSEARLDSAAQIARRILTILTELSDRLKLTVVSDEDDAGPTEKHQESAAPDYGNVVHCEICDKPIALGRVEAIPGVRTCMGCAEKIESPQSTPAVFISDSDISRYEKKRARDIEDEESKGRARKSTRKRFKRKARKKSKRKTSGNRAK